MSDKNGLHDVNCCGQFLCSAPANTSVRCPNCYRWENVPGKNGNKLEEEAEKQYSAAVARHE